MEPSNTSGLNPDYMFRQLMGEIDVLSSIIILEYHGKNHLSGDDESRARVQLEMLARIKNLANDLRVNLLVKTSAKNGNN